MSKKIFFLIFIVFLIITPNEIVKGATTVEYFIGVTIASASAPGYLSNNNNWCLPVKSKFSIRNSTGATVLPVCGVSSCYLTPGENPITLQTPACEGDTIWSPLFKLTTGTPYRIYFETSEIGVNSYCPGYYFGGYCWVSWTTGKNCCEICSHYASEDVATSICNPEETNCQRGSKVDLYFSNKPGCAIEAYLMGAECSECNIGGSYGYFNLSNRECWTPFEGDFYDDESSCASPGSNYSRVCACKISNGASGTFYFDFVAPSS